MAPVNPSILTPACLNLSTKLLLAPTVCAYASNSRRSIHQSSSTQNRFSQHDVIIVGGGLVGTAMACALGCSKILSEKNIVLLEGAPVKPYSMKPNYSNRVSAVSPSSVGLFKDLGIWDVIRSHRVKEIKKMQVWDAYSNANITFNHDNMSSPVAYIIENDLLLWALAERLKDFPNISVKYNSKINNYALPKSKEEVPNLALDGGETLECKLLIGADGANSRIRSLMKTKYMNHNYNQMGVVATLRLSEETDNIVAWQRFLPTGPIALLPLTNYYSSLVWSTNPIHAKQLLSLPADSFVDAVNDAFWKEYAVKPFVKSVTDKFNSVLNTFNLASNEAVQLPPSVKYVDEGSRALFPLGCGHSTRYTNDCVVLIGDAAHRVHPLAGQGVNLGFGDVHCLAHLLEAAVYRGAHIGYGKHLKVYESERSKANANKVLGIHLLQRLYDTSFTPIVALRSIGLSMVHAMPDLKKTIMKNASS